MLHVYALPDHSSRLRGAFVGRQGGVSKAPFESMNIAENVGDAPLRVAENRARLLEKLGAPTPIVSIEQVHGGRIVDSAMLTPNSVPQADGLLMTGTDHSVLLQAADCPLVFLVGQDIAALVHAGWRGVAAGIMETSLESLAQHSRLDEVVAHVSPAIGACCFEVGHEVVDQVSPNPNRVRRQTPRPYLDLKGVIVDRLVERGLKKSHIHVHPDCTKCRRDLYFSYRGDGGTTGRNAGVMWIEG